MTTPFLGEIRIFSFGFAPKGWAQCDGQILAIAQNVGLFAVIGTFYGGDGIRTFGLPDMRGRAPMHQDQANGFTLGLLFGQETNTLLLSELPLHNHPLNAVNGGATSTSPMNNVLATTSPHTIYHNSSTNFVTMAPTAISNAGGSQPHENMMPFLALNFCIALTGIFPSRN